MSLQWIGTVRLDLGLNHHSRVLPSHGRRIVLLRHVPLSRGQQKHTVGIRVKRLLLRSELRLLHHRLGVVRHEKLILLLGIRSHGLLLAEVVLIQNHVAIAVVLVGELRLRSIRRGTYYELWGL